jgi:hypothetical protein
MGLGIKDKNRNNDQQPDKCFATLSAASLRVKHREPSIKTNVSKVSGCHPCFSKSVLPTSDWRDANVK